MPKKGFGLVTSANLVDDTGRGIFLGRLLGRGAEFSNTHNPSYEYILSDFTYKHDTVPAQQIKLKRPERNKEPKIMDFEN